jgi:hypothetical protein
MAHMNQEKKAKIAAELKKVMPKDWKWTLGVRHHSTIILNIWSSPIDLLAHIEENHKKAYPEHQREKKAVAWDVNEYHLDKQFSGTLLDLFKKVVAALNTDNFDKSDPMSDYFHVGHYVDINIGRWDKPFICTTTAAEVA